MSHDSQAKRKLIEEIHGSIDLGFSDYYEDQNVRGRTLDAHAVELRRAVELLTLEEAINSSLFQSFGSSHPSGTDWRQIDRPTFHETTVQDCEWKT